MENQVAQLGNDLVLGLAVECGNERQFHSAPLVEGNEQPFLGTLDVGNGRYLAHHVFGHNGRQGGFPSHLVVVLKRHDKHRVGVLANLTRLGIRRMTLPSAVSLKVVLLIGP